MPGGVLRLYQEHWFPFANLPAALEAFTRATGIRTELAWDAVGIGTIEHMFDQMIGSFSAPRPVYDLICTDEIILQEMARKRLVEDLRPRMARDGLRLDHVSEATRQAVTFGEAIVGLPCVNVSSMVMYRADLFEKYRLPVPSDWAELREVARTLQQAVRRDTGRADFYGFETRGAGGGGHSVYTVGSFLGSFGARWLTPEGDVEPISDAHERALSTYLELLREAGPPDQGAISFVEMRRDMASGRVGMIMDVGMEYAHVIQNVPALADRVGVALVPAGPAGRAPNLYAPPWAIPANSDMQDEAFELARYLTSDRQLLEDGLKANAIETASLPVLYSAAFDRHFRADILAVTRACRAVQKQERPFSPMGVGACTIVGDNVHRALVGALTAEQALEAIHSGLVALDQGSRQ